MVETAHQRGISQPAVTAHLQRLEAELGQPLFVPRGRSKSPTHFARSLHSHVAPPMRNLRRAVETVKTDFAAPEQLLLRIACRGEIIPSLVNRLSFPGQISWISHGSERALEALTQGDVDIAILSSKPDIADVVAKSVIKDGAVLIIPRSALPPQTKSAGTAGKKHQSRKPTHIINLIQTIRAHTWVFYRTDAPLAGPLLRRAGINPAELRRVECENWRAIIDLVASGRGVSVVPEGVLAGTPYSSDDSDLIVRIPVPESILPPVEMWAVFYKSLIRSAVIREAVATLKRAEVE